VSLLREALRKAELARDQARPQEGAGDSSVEPAAPFAPLALQEDADRPAASEVDPVETPEALADALATDVASPPADLPAEAAAVTKSAFEQQMREPNPRLAFHASVALLGAAALGALGYFWLQLRPPASIVHAAPARVAEAADRAAPKPASGEPLLATTEQALASLPDPAARANKSETIVESSSSPAEPPPASPDRTASAEAKSLRALVEQTQASYRPPLEAVAEDSPAGGAPPSTLGYEHARNGRWAQAREAYALAAADDPQNPDFAFNLAVSHDHLRERQRAMTLYQRALELQRERPAQFSADAARERLRSLAR
jgi:tetratricopeptide (TPR) repeat protein